MQLSPLSREQIRGIDEIAIREFGIPGVCLVENAGRGSADFIASLGQPGPMTILCGPGNNGGDGFVIARHLDAASIDVEIVLLCDPERYTGDARIN